MTPDQMSFRESLAADPAQLARIHAMSAQALQQLSVPSSFDDLAALTEVYAVLVARMAAENRLAWLPLKRLLADMRKHILDHMPPGQEHRSPKAGRARADGDTLSASEINLLRGLLAYPHGAPLSMVERDSNIERLYLNRAARISREKGHIQHDAVKTNLHYYRITEAGRNALAKYDAGREQRRANGAALVANPRPQERKPSAPKRHSL